MTNHSSESGSPQWKLLSAEGSEAQEIFALTRNITTIGRDPDNDITLDDEQISRHHTRLTQQRGQLIIEDLHSESGTVVNDEPLTGPYALQSDDTIGLGPFTFRVQGPPATPPELVPVPVSEKTSAAFPFTRELLIALAGLLILGGMFVGAGLMWWLISQYATVTLAPTVTSTPVAPTLSETAISEAPTLTPPETSPHTITPTVLPTDSPADTPTPTNTPIVLDVPLISLSQAPAEGSQLLLNHPVIVQAVASDPTGILRLELWVNNERVAEVVSPNGENPASMSAALQWLPTVAGQYELQLRAQNQIGLIAAVPVANVTIGGNGSNVSSDTIPGAIAPTPPPTPTPRPSPTPTAQPTSPALPPTFTPGPPTATAIPLLTVNAATLNVRAGPSTDYSLVGQLGRREQVAIIGQADAGAGRWWQVQFSNGLGWLPDDPKIVTTSNTDTVPAVGIPAPPQPILAGTVTPSPVSEPILRPPAGKTLLIVSNRSLENYPAMLTLSGGKSVGGGQQIDVGRDREAQLVLEPDVYRAMWSSPVDNFVRSTDITAVAGKIIVMWVVPEEGRTDIEFYDSLPPHTVPTATPTATPLPGPTPTPYVAPSGRALLVAENRSLENAYSVLTVAGGSYAGGQEFILDAGTVSLVELAPGDYRVIWSSPARRHGFSAGHQFSVIPGEVIEAWIIPEDGQVFMQFPGQPPKQINN